MDTTFTFIIPTVGRDTLARTLASIKGQELFPGDEVLVIGDGHHPSAEADFMASGLNGRYLYIHPQEAKWGRSQRMLGASIAKGDYLAFIDDDDVYAPGVLKEARQAVAQAPGLYLFKTILPNGVRIPQEHKIFCGNVTTGCIVTKNQLGKVGTWTEGYDQDFHFARTTAELWGPENVFFPNITLTVFRDMAQL